ncbi:Lin0512 family protein [Marimonas lutisalis]|uniref:Lin0512 family protein n=1 Tax=Marimonas lutisalis TaxID=2545756 RepID=UPI0010F5B15B|nr:Lin0512 family protein [Marimonas lutisalis]
MTDRRFIIEMAQGTDLHGGDYTKAALRAVRAALQGSSLALLGGEGIDPAAMRVQVTVGVQDPNAVDRAAIAALLPAGRVTVDVIHGGLDHAGPRGGAPIVIATAAVEAFLPDHPGGWRAAT